MKKNSDAVPGFTLLPEQAILVRAIVDREGGDEKTLLQELLNQAFADSALIKKFVRRIKAHPEWHVGMHEAGLYPADIFAAEKKIRKAAQKK